MHESMNKSGDRPIRKKGEYKRAVKKATHCRLRLEREEERICEYLAWLRTKHNSQENFQG